MSNPSTITEFPTRITNHSATSINNIYFNSIEHYRDV